MQAVAIYQLKVYSFLSQVPISFHTLVFICFQTKVFLFFCVEDLFQFVQHLLGIFCLKGVPYKLGNTLSSYITNHFQ